MLKVSLTINETLLSTLKELPDRTKRNFKTKLRTVLKPELQQETEARMNVDPGAVSEPFQFGSRNSQIYYLMLVRKNPELSDGDHWIRTGELQSSFRVEVGDYLYADSLITIRNIAHRSTGTKPYPARYVYSPWAVAGHINTGWAAQFDTAKAELRQYALRRIVELRNEGLREAMKGKDS